MHKAKGQFGVALAYLDSALQTSSDERVPKAIKLKILKELAESQEYNSDLERSYIFLKRYSSLRDSTYSFEKMAEIGKLETERLLTERNLSQERQLIRKQRIQHSIVFILLVVIIGALFYIRRFNINPKVLGSTIFLIILMTFELILAIFDPLITNISDNVPVLILAGNFVIALMFVPIHRLLETWFQRKIIQKSVPKETTSAS